MVGFVTDEVTSQSAIAVSSNSLGSTEDTVLRLVVTSLSPEEARGVSETTLVSRVPSVRNSSSAKRALVLFGSKASFHVFSGTRKSIGASRLIVASIFENNASSSPFFISSKIRGVIPASRQVKLDAFNFSYIFSMVPNSFMRMVAVFSPIPLIPIMLSEGSPRSPL